MSVRVMAMIWNLQIKTIEKLVALRLAHWEDIIAAPMAGEAGE